MIRGSLVVLYSKIRKQRGTSNGKGWCWSGRIYYSGCNRAVVRSCAGLLMIKDDFFEVLGQAFGKGLHFLPSETTL